MDTNGQDIDLETVASRPIEDSLPPCDCGFAAWRFLAVAYVFETLLWGFPLSFGVFQEYYSRLPQFQEHALIGVVGTIASGMSYIAAPIVIPFIGRHSRYRRLMILIGWPFCILGLVTGSFATTLESLILTQGVMYGLGFIIFYYPILSILNEYWVDRRGTAYGIMCSASGVSGATMPFVVQALLQRYGYPTTLRAIAVGLALLTGPLIPLLKGRLPEADITTATRINWSFLSRSSFWMYSLSNLAMGMGYFFPALYLPSYAVANGMSLLQGALLLAIMSVSQVAGQFSFGYASDHKFSVEVLTTTSTVVAAIAVLACWGFAKTFAPLVVFAIIYGFFASGYTATWARIGSSVTSDSTAAFAAFGLLNLQKGIGNVLTGPVGGALVGSSVTRSDYGIDQYKQIVFFTGACLLISGGLVITYQAGRLRKLFSSG